MITAIPTFVSSLIDTLRLRPFVANHESFPENAPFFFHGSPMEIQSQIKQLKYTSKFPAIFLIEYIEDEINLDRTKNVGSSPQLKLFFMDEYSDAFDIEDQYSEVINVMDELHREFIKVCQRNRYILKIESYRPIRHSKWGIYKKDAGNLTPVFTEKLSGVEVNLKLDIDKTIDGCQLMETN